MMQNVYYVMACVSAREIMNMQHSAARQCAVGWLPEDKLSSRQLVGLSLPSVRRFQRAQRVKYACG